CRCHPRYPLILAANRDEFYHRPTAPASFWETEPKILAGKDLKSGGTWLGITRNGRIAALSNYRDPSHLLYNAPSRGGLVTEFLLGDIPPAGYLEKLRQRSHEYNGFSIIFGDRKNLYVYSNRGEVPSLLQPGIHGLSNHLLDTPWPKVTQGKKALADILSQGGEPSVDDIFSLLADRSPPDDRLLPDTGVDLETERLLAPLFISGPAYGTRSSSLLLIDQDAEVTFIERTHNGTPVNDSTRTIHFKIEE
ncbi:MAG: NRDE family protein, partial [Deltaproteobacteria bacterium]|nr:NRDE family protein [Deltaproteobacteria bacterium]